MDLARMDTIPARQLRHRADRKSTRLNSSHTVIYTFSLHDALPISCYEQIAMAHPLGRFSSRHGSGSHGHHTGSTAPPPCRSEEHTSELQSHRDLHFFPTRRSSDLVLRANSDGTPSRAVFFQAWIWLAWTPYRLDSSATV